jgi:DNA-binding NarL/FixJ family response regulator
MFRTLIVEDNVTFRKTLKNLLSSRFSQMTIQEAGDGVEALRKIDADPPDLVFMDVKLPGENGLSLTTKIKKAHSRITVIVITSYDLPEYRYAAQASGANHFLSKGTSTANEILSLVESVLEKRGNGGKDPGNGSGSGPAPGEGKDP